MAVNSNDPTTGHPIFSDSDAPDIKVDPTKVAEYAGKVGTRLIGTTAERTAYTFAREGLRWYDTDLAGELVHDGSGWKDRTELLVCQVSSSHALINGTTTIAWTDAISGLYVDTGGFWSSGAATRLTVPRAGLYRVSYMIRTNAALPITVTPNVNGSPVSYLYASGVGASGAASQAGRTFLYVCSAGDYFTFPATSTGAGDGTHTVYIEFLGTV